MNVSSWNGLEISRCETEILPPCPIVCGPSLVGLWVIAFFSFFFFFFGARRERAKVQCRKNPSAGVCCAMIGARHRGWLSVLYYYRLRNNTRRIYVALQITLFARTIDLRLHVSAFCSFLEFRRLKCKLAIPPSPSERVSGISRVRSNTLLSVSIMRTKRRKIDRIGYSQNQFASMRFFKILLLYGTLNCKIFLLKSSFKECFAQFIVIVFITYCGFIDLQY